MHPRVLLVDDEPEVIAAVQAALKAEGFEVVGVTSTTEALERLAHEPFHVLVSDEEMPEMKGSEFLAQAQRAYPTIPRIMLSGRADVHALTRAVNDAEIFRFLAKPVRASELAQVIRDAFALQQLARVHREVWTAAQAQHAALTALTSSQPTPDAIERSHERVRFAGFRIESTRSETPVGLPGGYAVRLSLREREIVESMAMGRRVKDIAEQFSISTHTVRNHLKAVYRKLNVRSQLELLSLITRNPGTDNASR